MTTAQSPIGKIRKQATKIARTLKAALTDPHPRFDAARKNPGFKAGIVMDDKVITLNVPWETIRETSEVALTEWIIKQMREIKDN